jgi:hypothetical protein
LFQGQSVHILDLHPFPETHPTIPENPAQGPATGIVITLTSRVPTLKPTRLASITDGQSNGSKRTGQRPEEGRETKRLRAASILPTREDSSTALRAHFLSLPLDERLQFLSWLFEGALPRCMPDAGPAAREDENVQSTGRSPPPYRIERRVRMTAVRPKAGPGSAGHGPLQRGSFCRS